VDDRNIYPSLPSGGDRIMVGSVGNFSDLSSRNIRKDERLIGSFNVNFTYLFKRPFKTALAMI